jgi:hypothetical protein
MGRYGLDSSGSEQGLLWGGGSCQQGNESSGFIKCWEILDYLSDCWLLENVSAPWSQLMFATTGIRVQAWWEFSFRCGTRKSSQSIRWISSGRYSEGSESRQTSKIWSWAPWDSEPRITVLAKASSNLAIRIPRALFLACEWIWIFQLHLVRKWLRRALSLLPQISSSPDF